MDDIRNVVFLRFRDVTKQNGCASMGTLYREPLGEIVVYYDNVIKNQKRAEVIHTNVPLCALNFFGLLSC